MNKEYRCLKSFETFKNTGPKQIIIFIKATYIQQNYFNNISIIRKRLPTLYIILYINNFIRTFRTSQGFFFFETYAIFFLF